MEKDLLHLTIIITFISVIVGYIAHIYKTSLRYKYEKQINEIDLLDRIDKLQQKILLMAKENALLREEIASLKQELKGIKNAVLS